MALIRKEFLVSAVKAGVPEHLEPELATMLRKMRRVSGEKGYSRFLNRARFAVTGFLQPAPVEAPHNIGWKAQGFVGVSPQGKVKITAARSRKMVEVVAGFAEALAYASTFMQLHEGGTCEVRVWRMDHTRQKEFWSLDAARALLVKAGMIETPKFRPNISGSSWRTGFKFRLGAGWSGSPELMFVVLTVLKLAVFDPEMFLGAEYDPKERISNLLAFYQGRDDDARLAYAVWSRGLPKPDGVLSKVWGVAAPGVERLVPAALPKVLKLHPDAAWGMLNRLQGREGIRFAVPEVKELKIPRGWKNVATNYKGLEGLVSGLMMSGIQMVALGGWKAQPVLQMPVELADAKLLAELERILGGKIATVRGTKIVYLCDDWAKKAVEIRKVFERLPCFGRADRLPEKAWAFPYVKPKKPHRKDGVMLYPNAAGERVVIRNNPEEGY